MKVVIIGGGAAGMMAAVTAAGNGHKVTVIEHKDRLGKKLLATGNGRCNLSNEALGFEPWDYYGVDENNSGYALIKSVFNKFGYDDTIRFFNELGLMVKSRNGLVYPYSDQASAVLDVLRFKIRDMGIEVICGCHAEEIEPGFRIVTDKGEFKADRVIMAAGSCAQPKLGADGSGYKLLEKLGHKITPVSPGLVQIRCREDYFKSIAGIRMPASVSLYGPDEIYTESGELQITAYGVSGIVIMNLSNRLSKCEKEKYIVIDLLENMTEREVRKLIFNRCEAFKLRRAGELLIGILPKMLGELFLRLCGITVDTKVSWISDYQKEQLAGYLKNWKVRIQGTNTFEEAQICLGGLDPSELTDCLESKITPGLFVAGEIIDVHGDCGGFNLQQAWSTGAVAGLLGS